MTQLFERVLACPPSLGYPKCISENPEKSTIDLDLALKQHQLYVQTLRDHGVKVELWESEESLPDSVFVEDVWLMGGQRALVGRFAVPSRSRENEVLARYLEGRMLMERVAAPATLEGGDVLIAEDQVLVGVSGRTNAEGYKAVKRCFPKVDVRPVEFGGGFFHMLSVCSYLGDGLVLRCKDFVDSSAFTGFECLDVARENAAACNVLPLGNGSILVHRGYPQVRDTLDERGFDPVEIDLSEFVKGDGSITCLNLPFYPGLV